MSDLKGSTASVITAVSGTTRFIVSDGGSDGVATGALVEAYVGNTIRKITSATQAISSSTLTKITNSDLAVPSGGIRVGTVFRWYLILTKTAAGASARTFHVRIGTAGTTADTAVATITSPAGTAAIDAAAIEIIAICTAVGASATFETSFVLSHNLASTGFATIASQVVAPATSTATINSTTANLIATLSITTGSSEAPTVRQVVAEALNL